MNAKKTPEADPSSIGNLALELGYITQDQLKEALAIQEQRMALGDILVDRKMLTLYQRDELLLEQRYRREKHGGWLSSRVSKDRMRRSMLELERQRLAVQHVRSGLASITETGGELVGQLHKRQSQ